jgi:hypothetical protein
MVHNDKHPSSIESAILSIRVLQRVSGRLSISSRPLMSSSETLTTSMKMGGYQFYRDVLGSPRHVVAPMVDQSELVRLIVFIESFFC